MGYQTRTAQETSTRTGVIATWASTHRRRTRSTEVPHRFSHPRSDFCLASSSDARQKPERGRLHGRGSSIGGVRCTGGKGYGTPRVGAISRVIANVLFFAESSRHAPFFRLFPRKRSAYVRRPNITSTNTTRDQIGGWSSAGSNLSRGALSTTWINNDGPRAQSSYRNGYYHMISLNAQGSSEVYGKSSSVQPASLRVLPAIKF